MANWRQCVDEDMAKLNLSVMDTHDREVWRNGILGNHLTRAVARVSVNAQTGVFKSRKTVKNVQNICLSVWPSGLGRTPLSREGPGSSPGAGKLDSGYPPERVGQMSSN